MAEGLWHKPAHSTNLQVPDKLSTVDFVFLVQVLEVHVQKGSPDGHKVPDRISWRVENAKWSRV